MHARIKVPGSGINNKTQTFENRLTTILLKHELNDCTEVDRNHYRYVVTDVVLVYWLLENCPDVFYS